MPDLEKFALEYRELDGRGASRSPLFSGLFSSHAFLTDAWPGEDPGLFLREAADQMASARAALVLEQDGVWDWAVGIRSLDFDSRVFGKEMAFLSPLAHRVTWPEPGALTRGERFMRRAASLARGLGVEGLVARVSSRNYLAARSLEAAGFRLADVSVEWLLDLDRREAPPEPPPGYTLAPARPEDHPGLLDLAATAFNRPEHYADRFALDPVMAPHTGLLYRRWMENSLSGEQADLVLALNGPGGTAGFICLKHPRPGGPGEDCGWVSLNAVREDQRGRGLYNLILAHGLYRLREAGAKMARVRTKLTQGAVIRAWSRLGARQAHSDLTFHLWLG